MGALQSQYESFYAASHGVGGEGDGTSQLYTPGHHEVEKPVYEKVDRDKDGYANVNKGNNPNKPHKPKPVKNPEHHDKVDKPTTTTTVSTDQSIYEGTPQDKYGNTSYDKLKDKNTATAAATRTQAILNAIQYNQGGY